MPTIALRIPQLGEGLQEARLIELLKQPGDRLRRDEPCYVMETDKATTEVESPYDGELIEWLVTPDSVLPIGAEIGRVSVAEGVSEMANVHGPTIDAAAIHDPPRDITQDSGGLPSASMATDQANEKIDEPPWPNRRGPIRAAGGIRIPPRTRRYLQDHQLIEMADKIEAIGTKLMPEDVDRFIASGGPDRVTIDATRNRALYTERELPPAQQTLNYRMTRGSHVVVAATLMKDLDWTAIEAARVKSHLAGGPSGFRMFLYCTAQALASHPSVRSSLSADGTTMRTYHHVNLGVAVALPGDLLKIAVVERADTLRQVEFFATLRHQIDMARMGRDQIEASTTVAVSNMSKSGMRAGIPIVVTPAVATLAIGEVRDLAVPAENSDGFRFQKTATLSMTFDHRVLNGVGAAAFLNEIAERAAAFELD